MSRTGKIARLPQPLREELNHRIENGELGRNLAVWLNSLPEVTTVLATHFDNQPVSEQNLSDWRRGGFLEWQVHRELLAGAADCAEASADYAACGVSAKHFLAILNAHFASNLQSWDGGYTGESLQHLRTLKSLYATVLSLRRSEQHDDRLALDRERLEFAREKQSCRPPHQPKSPRPSSTPVSPKNPKNTPPIPPRPNSPTHPPSTIQSAQQPCTTHPTQTTPKNPLETAPSIPSISSISSTEPSEQSPAPAFTNFPQKVDPNPQLSKPAPPHPAPTPSIPTAPTDFDWSGAAYDYPG